MMCFFKTALFFLLLQRALAAESPPFESVASEYRDLAEKPIDDRSADSVLTLKKVHQFDKIMIIKGAIPFKNSDDHLYEKTKSTANYEARIVRPRRDEPDARLRNPRLLQLSKLGYTRLHKSILIKSKSPIDFGLVFPDTGVAIDGAYAIWEPTNNQIKLAAVSVVPESMNTAEIFLADGRLFAAKWNLLQKIWRSDGKNSFYCTPLHVGTLDSSYVVWHWTSATPENTFPGEGFFCLSEKNQSVTRFFDGRISSWSYHRTCENQFLVMICAGSKSRLLSFEGEKIFLRELDLDNKVHGCIPSYFRATDASELLVFEDQSGFIECFQLPETEKAAIPGE